MIPENRYNANLKLSEGADIEWTLSGTGPAIVNAMEHGKINLAFIDLPPAIKTKMNEMRNDKNLL
jgi:hypothetical protein